MRIRALENLKTARLAGRKPAGYVSVWLDAWPEFADPDCDVLVGPGETVSRLDLRPLVGCLATLYVEAMTPRAAAMVDRMRAVCAEVVVIVESWLDRGEAGFRVAASGDPEPLPEAA